MSNRESIIKAMISHRTHSPVNKVGLSLMSTPEATAFTILYQYIKQEKIGYTPIEIIDNLEKEDNIYSPENKTSSYPREIKAYVLFKINQDHPFDGSLISRTLVEEYLTTVIPNELNKLARPQTHTTTYTPKKKEGCYIATACYGGYDTPQVLTFRKYRDEKLKKQMLGRIFIKVYYQLSPLLVSMFMHNHFVNKKIKRFLDLVYKKMNEI